VIAQSREHVDGKIETATYAIRGGKLVIERVRDGISVDPVTIDSPVHLFKGALVVIVDDSTAGASEIATQALQESGRAQVVGTTTAGKGVGQRSIYLNGKHAMRVSTIRYFSGSGKELDGKGVEPNLKVEAKDKAFIFEKGMARLKEIAPQPKPKEADPASSPTPAPTDKQQ
jgi:carboxyl-terminal processing protease